MSPYKNNEIYSEDGFKEYIEEYCEDNFEEGFFINETTSNIFA